MNLNIFQISSNEIIIWRVDHEKEKNKSSYAATRDPKGRLKQNINLIQLINNKKIICYYEFCILIRDQKKA